MNTHTPTSGSVTLVGAGPGDPELLTIKAVKAIRQATVLLVDDLVDDGVLRYARRSARIVHVGKRGGCPSTPQSFIHTLMIAEAKRGERVVRLKGGDPFVFGRGGEEAQALARAGVPFRIVPGITAGIGGLAYAGIPVTHRDTNHAVTFITGHGSDGKLPHLDWGRVAKSAPTLVFYMGRKFAGEIAQVLIAGGRDAQEPAAIVANAARPDQSVIVTTLGGLGDAAERSPALSIIVIGENVNLAKELAWLERHA